ncbi:MAG: helix-turn-helix domain-containing protein [Candidatus Nezhaarchaeota archaeon]|nr:helix-turn-helix domain-containing protein [Candidatus Nezhaarchaeota archaeon]MCX8141755.1 helix-turn-helix domain-containing protein [Candidatus Nezhaarchaeota archaeon]MDW8050467.1 helix-turn-helix domain-containing protein [Nitrososphaerota archaeon]
MRRREVDLLEILGNETRRRILELLAKEPKYLLQMSRELNISQQAILKHINLLLRAGLIRVCEVKKGSLGPSRKYYELVKPISMTIDVFKGFTEVNVREISGELPDDIKKMLKTVEDAIVSRPGTVELILDEAKRLIREIDDRLREIREKERALLSAKCKVLDLIYRFMRGQVEELMD